MGRQPWFHPAWTGRDGTSANCSLLALSNLVYRSAMRVSLHGQSWEQIIEDCLNSLA